MLTSPVPTAESEDPMTVEEQNLLSIALVAQVLVRRHGGEVTIPVSDLFAAAKLEAQWDRVGDNIVIRVGELCLK